jgi:hypothetical protein
VTTNPLNNEEDDCNRIDITDMDRPEIDLKKRGSSNGGLNKERGNPASGEASRLRERIKGAEAYLQARRVGGS